MHDGKGALHLDANTGWLWLVSAYYFAERYHLDNPYPTQQGGANVPGFNALSDGRSQFLNVSSAKPLGTDAVNEFRASVVTMRSSMARTPSTAISIA